MDIDSLSKTSVFRVVIKIEMDYIRKENAMDANTNSEDEINQKDDLFDENITLTDEMNEILLNTREQCQMMEQLIKNQIEVKDKMIDRLHKELDFYKNATEDKFVDQLMKAVIKVHKDMCRRVNSENWKSLEAEDLRKEYQYTLEDVEDLLEQQNVDSYFSNPGALFDAAIHQPKMEVTDDLSLDRKVKESISKGYKKGDKVLVSERVIVYKYQAQN